MALTTAMFQNLPEVLYNSFVFAIVTSDRRQMNIDARWSPTSSQFRTASRQVLMQTCSRMTCTVIDGKNAQPSERFTVQEEQLLSGMQCIPSCYAASLAAAKITLTQVHHNLAHGVSMLIWLRFGRNWLAFSKLAD